jgi:lipopolysaccharide export system protein LptA
MKFLFHKRFKAPVFFTGTFSIVLFLFSTFSVAQSQVKTKSRSQIEILNANTLEIERTGSENIKRLIGDVQLKHEDALMFCDSAYVYSTSNTMDAYGHVKILQGDSLRLYGDSLKYNGNTRIAILRGDIKLINKDVELSTNYLDYDRTNNIAYYYNGGTMLSRGKQDTLTSRKGYYYSESKSFFFKEDVVLNNPEYDIVADTLKYNSPTETVYFLGPTTITSDDNFIYTEDGWYNTKNNISEFFGNSYIFSDDKTIVGDTIYYERDNGYGEITCNAEIVDTAENVIIKGDVVHFFEEKDSVMVTEEALLMQLFTDDTLYLHGDTLKVSTQLVRKYVGVLEEGISPPDTFYIDTVRTLFAYNHVKFFKNDMQGRADSVVYNFSDSTINFYTDPVIWSEENQLTADSIYMLMSDGELHSVYMNNNAFIISKADSLLENFNQIKGKNMIAYFKDKEIKKIDVKKNAETIYYARDDDGKYIGVNKAHGENMLVFFEEKSLKSLTFINDPEGVLYPLNEPSPKDLMLKGFDWKIVERPKDMFDVFTP